MKRLLALSSLMLVALAPAAYASNPNHLGGCHGANDVPCRPDPQPTHGNDCTRSDDHSCDTTTTTAPEPTTSTTATSTTTTTTTPTAMPTTTTTFDSSTPSTTSPGGSQGPPPAGATAATCPDGLGFQLVTAPPCPSISPLSPASRTTELPRTGTDWLGLGMLGVSLIVLGVAMRLWFRR